MKLIEYTTQWAKGEMFEGLCIAIFGILTLLCTLIIWKYGTTINAKALVIPSLVLGLLFSAMGSFMVYSNNNRIAEFETAYQENPMEFTQLEKTRVEEFQILYPISLAISAVFFLVTLLSFVFSKSPTFHAIGIALSVFGLALIIIDYFSKERGQMYYEHIKNYL
jgi:glucan phosphoethanolaminetransferase (alkaline phosphatase superfamily)